MKQLLHHSQLRDLRFLVLVLLNLFLISGFLISGAGGDSALPGGWRRIDLQALQTRIDAGELVEIEARWYRTVTADEAGSAGE